MKGRIGVAKRVHVLARYDAKVQWAVSMCQAWAGKVVIVPDTTPVTCHLCKTLEQGSACSTKS